MMKVGSKNVKVWNPKDEIKKVLLEEGDLSAGCRLQRHRTWNREAVQIALMRFAKIPLVKWERSKFDKQRRIR